MKISALFAALFLLNIADLFAQNNGKSQLDGSYYSCTMHPKIHNDAPGTCPICGMDLEKIQPKKAKAKPKPALPAEVSAKEGENPPNPPPEMPKPTPEMKRDNVVFEKTKAVEPSHTGRARVELSREEIALAARLRLNLMVNSDKEYMVGGRFILTKCFSLSSHYDSDMGFGAGVTITY